MHSTLQLKNLKGPQDFSSLVLEPRFYRGDWLIGFGWDQHRFPEGKYPTRNDLDRLFPNYPVSFSRADGHAMWLNTKALEVCGLLKPVSEWNLPAGAEAHSDENGFPLGILIDRAMEVVFAKIPPDDFQKKKAFLKLAATVFNQEGFTHLRDMQGDEEQWSALAELDSAGEFNLYLDQNFLFEKPEDFEKALGLAVRASRDKYPHLKSRGVKFYLDGALGSEGAALSQPYGGSTADGFLIWDQQQIREWLTKTWEKNLEVSIHAIGDRASHLIAIEARKLWDAGKSGFLNLEHAEVIRTETLRLLDPKQVRLHMQPCHWLTDRNWLKQKLGSLTASCFQWNQAHQLGLPLSWGSDSPIEQPKIFDNYQALRDSPPEIPAYPDLWWKPHEHPNSNWGANCKTTLNENGVNQVIFDGRILEKSPLV